MRIIIAGAGDVGFHLAKLLAHEAHDIVLIDTDADKLKYASEHLDIAAIKGSASSYSVLEDAKVSKADLVISATSSEEANIATAIIAKHLGAKKTVARISNEEYLLKKEKLDLQSLGIDELISPETLAAREIKRLLKESALTDSFDFDKGVLSLMGISITGTGQLAGRTIMETAPLNPDGKFITVAILRNNQTIIPRGDTVFQTGDHAYFVALPEGVEKVLELAGKERVKIKDVMILGGSKVGFHTARKLALKYNIKIVEPDRERCEELADQLPGVLIINGDGRDTDLLEEENISEMDAFIAVTENSETNIISCLVAKNHGVKKTIAMVENIDYIHLSQNIGVDTMINKKLIAANFIFRYIREGDVVSLTSMHGVNAEIVEYKVDDDAKILSDELRKLDFPKGAIIGGVIRNGRGYIAMGDFRFQPNDRVVVVTMPECMKKVENFFR